MAHGITQYTPNDIYLMAKSVSNSGLFGINNVDQAMSLMLIAQAEGLHPAVAARDYHIVKGRPTLKADTMLARFQNAGGKIKWIEYSSNICKAIFFHPSGGELEIEWTLETAKKAELSTKKNKDGSKNNYEKYPRQNLSARVISEGVRKIFPGVLNGMYTPEEIMDLDNSRKTVETEYVIEDKKKEKYEIDIKKLHLKIDKILALNSNPEPEWERIKEIAKKDGLLTVDGVAYLKKKYDHWSKEKETPPKNITDEEKQKIKEKIQKDAIDYAFANYSESVDWDRLEDDLNNDNASQEILDYFTEKKKEGSA